MEKKTVVHAVEGRQELFISREFDLPLELLFKAHEDAEIVEQWMGTKVVKFENKKHGSWQYVTSDDKGNVLFKASGVFHEFVPNTKITRTFEMENMKSEPQLEFMEFERLTDGTSRLSIHMVFRSVEIRDQLLKMPFSYGINMAHNQLQKIVEKLK